MSAHAVHLRYAWRAAEAAGVADKLRLLTGRAEALPLEDGSADAVVMTHVRLTTQLSMMTNGRQCRCMYRLLVGA